MRYSLFYDNKNKLVFLQIMRVLVLYICLLGWHGISKANDLGHLTLFGQAAVSDTVNGSSRLEGDNQPTIAGDFLYTYYGDRLRWLASFYIDDEESELERLSIGFKLTDSTTLWAGKLHNPTEYWLNEYHRGAYISTSITSPFESLAGFKGGITSKHVSGAKLVKEFSISEAQTLTLDYTYADAPQLAVSAPSVSVFDVIHNHGSSNSMSIIRAVYQPWALNDSTFGVSYGDGDLGGPNQKELNQAFGTSFGTLLGGINIEQKATNIFANIYYKDWHFLASYLKTTITLTPVETPTQLFFQDDDTDLELQLNYGHIERIINKDWTVFGRYEYSVADQFSSEAQTFLKALNFDFDYEKTLIGARWDFHPNHAVTFQYTDHDALGARRNMMHLSWTFVWDRGL